MSFVVAFILFFLAFCFLFPLFAFYSDYMQSTQWDQRTALDYAGFTFCGAVFCILVASAVYFFVVL